MDNSLSPIEKTVRTLYFKYCFAQLEHLYIAQFADHRLRIVAEWVVDVILLRVGLKCLSMRMIFDLFDELLNSEMFCFFHNCMWQSWYSEVSVELLLLGGLLSTYAPPRSSWVLDVLVTKQDIFLEDPCDSCPWVHRRKEYRLSFPAGILSSRYQSWICDGV